MKEVKRCLNPFNNYEYEYLECMLNDMVKEGLILEKCNFLLKFRSSTKHYGRYAVISKPATYVSEEEKDIWKNADWDYIDEYQGLEIYYTEDIYAEEPFTEPEDIRMQKKKFVKTSVFNAIASLLLAAMIIYENVSVPWAEPGILHQINAYGPIGYVISAGTGVLMILAFIYSLVVMIRVIKRSNEYEAVTIEECRNRKKKNNIRFAICILALAVILGSAGVNLIKEHKDNDNSGNAVHPVLVSEIDKEISDYVKDRPRTVQGVLGYWEEDREYSFVSWKNLLFSEYDEENAKSLKDYSKYHAWYGNAKSEKIAEKYLQEDMEYFLEDYHFKADEIEKIDIDGMDEAWFMEEDELVQILWLRKGCRIESVEMNIEKYDLRDLVEKYVEDLDEV